MGSASNKELAGRSGQVLDAAGQAISGDMIFHQAPDPFDGVGVVGRVCGQPQDAHARVGRQPGTHDLGVVHLDGIHGQVERAAGVGGGDLREEGDEMHSQLAVVIDREPGPSGGSVRTQNTRP